MSRARSRASDPDRTRARLIRAGERLFAERGVHQVRLLVEAILSAHQTAMDHDVGPALDALVAHGDPTVRDIVAIWVQALGGQLRERSGRDFLRIVPQVLDMVNPIVRRGAN